MKIVQSRMNRGAAAFGAHIFDLLVPSSIIELLYMLPRYRVLIRWYWDTDSNQLMCQVVSNISDKSF